MITVIQAMITTSDVVSGARWLSGTMPDSQSRAHMFESPLLPFRSLGIFVPCSGSLTCINEDLAIDSGGNVSE